ncbi:hypothetical protein YC2023_114583 [Brassica napus]
MEEHVTLQTCEAVKRRRLWPRDALWAAPLMVTGSGSSRPRHLRHEKSPESGSCGCGVNGGGSILPRSSFPQLKFLYVCYLCICIALITY